MPPQPLPLQPRTSTPFQNPMSPSIVSTPAPIPPQPQSPAVIPVHSTPSPAMSSSPAPVLVHAAPPPKKAFHAPVSSSTSSPCFL
jgi:ubiquitin carboxyl-terminal hydrolase 10